MEDPRDGDPPVREPGSDADGSESTAALPKALVVDDEKEVADAYALRLKGLCDTTTAYDGRAALQAIEAEEIDIVLLDRHMPGMSGDDVLEELEDRSFRGRVIMVTAIDPGFDVLDMPFDDYLCKPIEREDIRTAVQQQCTILGYELLGRYFSLASKRAVIEAELPTADRENHEEYATTETKCKTLHNRARRVLDASEEHIQRFDDIAREGR